MSTATLTLKDNLLEQLRDGGKMYVRDLGFIPADKVGECPMGCARTPLAFSAEVAGFNMMLAAMISDEAVPMPSAEERAAMENAVTSVEQASAMVTQSVEKLAQAVEALPDEALGERVTTPWGTESRRAELVNIAITHMAYHDGQINYIQTLYGDGESHWG
jgi:hypothetical protein